MRVVAVIALRRAQQQLTHPVTDMIHEVAVMADEQDSTAVGAQIVLQPRDGLEVEVVCRFVQQEQIRLSQQHPSEAETRPFAAGKKRCQLSLLLPAEAETCQHALNGRTPAVAVALLEFARELVILAAEAVQRGFVLRLRHLLLQGAELLLHAEDRLEDAFQLLQHRAPRADLPLLCQIAELQPLLHGHRAAVSRLQTGDNLHQRGFAAAVDADKPHSLTILKHQGCIAQHFVGAEALLNPLQREQNHEMNTSRKYGASGNILQCHQRQSGDG